MPRSTRILAWVWTVRSLLGFVVYSVVIPLSDRYSTVIPVARRELSAPPCLYLTMWMFFLMVPQRRRDAWWAVMTASLLSVGLIVTYMITDSNGLFYGIWFGNEWVLKTTGGRELAIFDDMLTLCVLTIGLLLADAPWKWSKKRSDDENNIVTTE